MAERNFFHSKDKLFFPKNGGAAEVTHHLAEEATISFGGGVSNKAQKNYEYYNEKKVGNSKVLIIGSTGFIGRFVTEASLSFGHPTYALIRPTTVKKELVQDLADSGIQVLYGCLEDHDSLVRAITQVDIVISIVGGDHILKQLKIVDAIKEVGTVKRFLPSEFGHDVDQADPAEPALTFYKNKRTIRRAVEEAMIPYTYICCNSIAGWPYYYHTHPTELPPPMDQVEIYGEAYFVTGPDIGAHTIKAMDDPCTLNTRLHFRPPKNFLSVNELAAIWEKKITKTLKRVVVTEGDLLLSAKESSFPTSIVAALTHDIFINGCQFKFPIQPPHHAEVCQLYPDIKYTTSTFDFTLSNIYIEFLCWML